MRPRVIVGVPYARSDTAERNAAAIWCIARWEALGFDVIVDDSGCEAELFVFNLARARNRLADKALSLGADVIVWADADTFVADVDVLDEAIVRALDCHGAVYPHDRYWRLGPVMSSLVVLNAGLVSIAGGLGLRERVDALSEPYRTSVSGVVVSSLDSYLAGLVWDERFHAWGYEDIAYALTARDVFGRALRLPGNVYHLWHPNDEYKRSTTAPHRALVAAYEAAAVAGPHELRRLMADAAEHRGASLEEITRLRKLSL